MHNNTNINDAPVLACTNVVKQYDDGAGIISVIDNLNFSLSQAERVAIIGSSGSGKSSLLHILGGLDTPTSGQVFVKEQDVHSLSQANQAKLRNQHLGFVYQFHHLLNEFNALENVAMPLRIGNVNAQEAEDKAQQALKLVGMSHRLTHKPSALSGGERQRVAIARAVVNRPDVLLADEPTGNLDASTGAQVYELLLSLQADTNMALVIVTHDLTLANKMQRCLTLKDGQLVQL